jgi:hypothetical protein
MQQAPGQQAPPPQQPASLDEIVVALVSVIIAAIKSRYFMILSCWNFVNPRLRELARSARAFAPSRTLWERIKSAGAGSAAVRFVQTLLRRRLQRCGR